MLIVLEGPDGVGKTTLAREIIALMPHEARALHAGPLGAGIHPLTAYEAPLRSYRAGAGVDIVCDRWHLGEAVYPSVLKRKTKWNMATERHLRLFMMSRGAYVVHLTSYHDELAQRLRARGDDLIEERMLGEILEGYDAVYRRGNFNQSLTHFVSPREIIAQAVTTDLEAACLRPFETYVGPPEPTMLIMGEARGVNGRYTYQRMPAFMPYPNTSGAFMLEHLEQLDTARDWVGLANACDVDDPLALWKTLKEPKVVALGKRAHNELTSVGVPHGSAPHPQFIRRFHNKHGRAYATVVMRSALTGEDMSAWRP